MPRPRRYRFRDEDIPFAAETLTYRLRQDTDGTSTRSEPVTVERADPQRFALHANYPNPPTSRTTVPYELTQLGPHPWVRHSQEASDGRAP